MSKLRLSNFFINVFIVVYACMDDSAIQFIEVVVGSYQKQCYNPLAILFSTRKPQTPIGNWQ